MVIEAPKDKPTEVTRETFKEWTASCGVRCVQEAYDQVSREAQAEGRSAIEEMKRRGFKDFHAFSKACPQFSVKCWPIELAELGSGYVLYFHFIAFLAALLGFMFLLQTPAMVVYAQADADNLCRWGGLTDWQQLYRLSAQGANVTSSCGSHSYISSGYLTPGNLGPDSTSSSTLFSVYAACIFVLCASAFCVYQHTKIMEVKIDTKTVSPNDFAVIVRGLPQSATDERAIADFFREHAVEGKTDTEVVKVVIGWDACEFREKIKEIRNLRKQLSELEPDDPRYAEVMQRMKTLGEELSSVGRAGSQAVRLTSSGTVVVVFRYAADMRACLKKWHGVHAQLFYRQTQDISLLPAGNSLWLGEPLPKFPIGSPPVPAFKLSIERSANPGDINWEELGVEWKVKMKKQLKTNGWMLFLIIVCFFITYGLNKAQDAVREAKEENEGSMGTALSFISLLPAIGIAATNVFLCVIAKRQADEEYHDTFTEQEGSQALKMTAAMIINTAGVTYFCNAKPMDWYKSGGLVDDIVSVMFFQCFLAPLIFYLDPGWGIKGLQRRKLTDEKLEAFNENLKAGPPASKDAAMARQRVLAEIEFFKRAYAPNPMNNPRRYATALKNFVVCLMFMPLVPWVALIGFFGLALQYMVDKYLLLRWQQRPERPANSSMATFSMRALKYTAPLGLSVSTFVFLCPSWEDKVALWSNFYSCVLFSMVVSFLLPFSVWSKLFIPCLGMAKGSSPEEDYYKAQYMWAKEMKYHKDQFIYKKLPDSVNPEYLKPGVDSAVKVDAADISSGIAAADGCRRPAALPGGRLVDDADDLGSSPSKAAGLSDPAAAAEAGEAGEGSPAAYGAPSLGAYGSPGPAPVTLGAPSGSPAPTPGVSEPEVPPASLDSDVEVAGTLVVEPSVPMPPGTPEASGAATPQIWEFKVRAGWEAFDGSAQRELHQRYAEFMAGGEARVTITSGGRTISIFFDKMSSKLVGGKDRIRAIRNSKSKE